MYFENKFTLRAENVIRASHSCAANLGHGYVGSEHILLALCTECDGRASGYLANAGVTPGKVRELICKSVGRGIARENTAQGLSPHAKRIVRAACTYAKDDGSTYIGTEHILLGVIGEKTSAAKAILSAMNVDFEKLSQFLVASGGESEAEYRKIHDSRQGKEKNETKLLRNFGRDMCEAARNGAFDPVTGRCAETERMIRILSRRTKNNPLLLGEPGVGKTAIVEGLCERIVSGNVPETISSKRIFMLDIPSVVAGTKYRGEFEERIKSILREVSRLRDVILFIDEIHTIAGAGSAEGAIDAANILKPAMSRGEIQIIGATTFEEYKKNIERDSALARRFCTITVEEPSEECAFEILSGLRRKYEEHHRLTISDEALRAAISLSARYISERRLPDKAIDIIDEAASRARLSVSAPPPRLSELEENILQTGLLKEKCIYNEDFEAAAKLRDREEELRREQNALRREWEKNAMSKRGISASHIADVVSEQTKIPVAEISESESEKLLSLEQNLSTRVVGQEFAIGALSRAIRRRRCSISDPDRPTGSFLFAGPTGVGKTELCRALARCLFGSEKALLRVDMSEYMEKHEISKLTGAPPGYVGHGEGVSFADKVRRNPYSVILFDEIEKAHPDVFNILLQILEDGILTDSHGRRADFKNCIIVMTSNLGAEKLSTTRLGFGDGAGECEKKRKSVLSEITKAFRPELVNRIDEIVIFNKLSGCDIRKICDIMVDKTITRAKENGITLCVTDEAREKLAHLGFDEKYGAREIRRAVQRELEDNLAECFLKASCEKGSYEASIKDGKITVTKKETTSVH